MNTQDFLTDIPDEVTGIQYHNFAKVIRSQNLDGVMETNEFALIGFWELKNGKFECYHFFALIDPVKRPVRKDKTTVFYEVLMNG